MALSSRKISGFRELPTLTGDEYLMVAFNNHSYKVKTSLFTSDIIESINQKIVKGDGATSTITITTSAGATYSFDIINGQKGSEGNQGPQGKKGETGNAGLAIYNTELEDIIIDSVDGTNKEGKEISDEELTSYVLSARQGYLLNNKLEALNEVYISQEEYDEILAAEQIDPGMKYFIIEE